MDKPGSRQTQEEKLNYIIKSEKNWFLEGLLYIVSLILWGYCFFSLGFFLYAFFNINYITDIVKEELYFITNAEIRQFVIFSIIFLVIIYLFFWVWRIYNIKRFGNLDRRSYPEPTSKDELLNLGYLDQEKYKLLQRSKYLVLNKNPIINYDQKE
ncbi:MAG: poly-beta-1,6-N-acetyl-D-glucosamine biosynthesis protein PgaD [Halothermotrichaceae bacterium]